MKPLGALKLMIWSWNHWNLSWSKWRTRFLNTDQPYRISSNLLFSLFLTLTDLFIHIPLTMLQPPQVHWTITLSERRFTCTRRSRDSQESKIAEWENHTELFHHASHPETDERLHCKNWEVRFIQCCGYTSSLQGKEDWLSILGIHIYFPEHLRLKVIQH